MSSFQRSNTPTASHASPPNFSQTSSKENPQYPAASLRTRLLRFFFGLRWRLAFVYGTLFSIFGLILVVLISYFVQHAALRNLLIVVGIATIIMIAIGTIVIFFLTGIMLRPLRRMTDTVRAIALGDLKQRVQLNGLQSN